LPDFGLFVVLGEKFAAGAILGLHSKEIDIGV
jgi:hypothetical protein